MIETDSKKLREAEYTKTYTLSPEQLKQLFEAKISRAKQYHAASRKRETLCKEC
jgi:hypothetical protein